MLTLFDRGRSTRRDFLRLGAVGFGGLTLPDLLRLRATAAPAERVREKAVIFVYLFGGPSHIDMYDLKPDAPVEYRGEFSPIRTNVSGFDICELMPRQARIADKLALIRNMKFNPNFHEPAEILSGFRLPAQNVPAVRPDFGSVISRLRSGTGRRVLPAYIALDRMAGGERKNGPAYLGIAHQAFVAGEKLEGLELAQGVSPARLDERRGLLRAFDTLRQDVENARGDLAGTDAFRQQALDMVTSARVRDAFDITREPEHVRAAYGEHTRLLRARRLVEAGVPVVALTMFNLYDPDYRVEECGRFGWDTHRGNFQCLRHMLPRYDQGIHALITDLHERGLNEDVTVVIGGEMGRTPRVGDETQDGRGHWPQAGFSLIAGGGLRMGQVIGQTDSRAERPAGRPYTPQNVLATVYHTFGVDPAATTLPDHRGRPIYLLDDCDPVQELL